MTLLMTHSAKHTVHQDGDTAVDFAHYVEIFRKRIFFFAVPFVLLLTTGFFISAIQRPIYHAEGKLLVEPPSIPVDLVEPTVTAPATERVQVIQQRITSRDILLPVIKKFGLFASEQRWMSGTQLLDLMRDRVEIQLVDIDTELSQSKDAKKSGPPRPATKNPAVAFTVSFEYETPDLAMKVANELLTMILNDDAHTRTNRAIETTRFLAGEVKRLQGDLDSVNAQISEIKRKAEVSEAARLSNSTEEVSERLKSQLAILSAMKADLIQKTSVYAEAHPAVKSLRRRIEALEQEMARQPKVDPATPQAATDISALQQQQASIQSNLEESSKKLIAARLGESMERNQQSEPLLVIEQPTLPHAPIKPKRLKLFAISIALATMAGLGAVFLVEIVDRSIRGSRQLAGVVDSHLVVAIPYIATAGELSQKKRKAIFLWTGLVVFLLAGLALAFYVGSQANFSWFDQPWMETLTRLSK
jgi:uncharacterized protein involved in exopolysaccharide biosynthesis